MMKRGVRFTLAASVAVVFGAALYACSDSNEGTGGNNNVPDSSTNNGSDGTAGGDTATGPQTGQDAAHDSNQPPKSCDILKDGGPALEPEACRECAAQRCCTQITKCHGAPPAEPPLNGADGVKTACRLFGECEANCVLTHGQDAGAVAQCEFDCSQHYGAQAADDWAGSEGCIYAAEPAGCLKTCP